MSARKSNTRTVELALQVLRIALSSANRPFSTPNLVVSPRLVEFCQIDLWEQRV